MSSRPIVPQDRATIVAAAKEYTAADYAKKLGVTTAAVRYVARRHRVRFKDPQQERKSAISEDVKACHEAGLTVKETAEKLNIHVHTARNHWPADFELDHGNAEIVSAASAIRNLVTKDPNNPDNWRSYAGHENPPEASTGVPKTYHPESVVSTTGNSSVMAAEG